MVTIRQHDIDVVSAIQHVLVDVKWQAGDTDVFQLAVVTQLLQGRNSFVDDLV